MDVENRLRISGHAEQRVVPDRARWTATVRVEDADRDAAFARCAQARAGLIERLEMIEAGCTSAGRIAVTEEIEYYYVVGADVREQVTRELENTQLPELIIAQVGEWIGERRRRRRCFSAAATVGVDVTVSSSGAVPQLLVAPDLASSAGPFFEVSQREALADELRSRAVTNARERASRLATAAGRGLGRALLVSDRDESLASLGGATPPPAGAMHYAAASMTGGTRGLVTGAADGAPEPIVMEITPEPVELSETMTVVFELVDARLGG